MHLRLPLLVTVLAVTAGACTSYRVGAGPARSDGSVYVGGIQGGIGGGAELGGSREMFGGEVGVVATADLAGYSGGDGESPMWVGASVRYRGYLSAPESAVRWFYGVGAGPGVDRFEKYLVVEGFAELGARIRVNNGLAFTVGLRDRPAAFVGSGDPAVEPHNTLQLGLGIELTP
jgi:hypothetical protein